MTALVRRRSEARAAAAAVLVRSVYVHAPFCRRRCPYCDYAVTVVDPGRVREARERWLDAIRAEWGRACRREGMEVGALETLYAGGGTPSLLGPEAMEGLREILGERLLESPGLEWTVEANPEDVTRRLARGWARCGVTRASVGVQSFRDEPLRWLGRPHRAEHSTAAVRHLREAGIENVNVDLAFGLPEPAGQDWEEELDRVAGLRPEHVTLQEISVEPGTELAARVRRGVERMPEAGWIRQAYRLASVRLQAAGYLHYEASSFALPGRESRHTLALAAGAPFLGLGNAAHSFIPPRRSWNLAEWEGYCTAALDDTLSPEATVGGAEEPTEAEARLETLWLRLRTRTGIRRADLPAGSEGVVGRWIREGLAELEEGRVRMTPEGWLRLDDLVIELERTFPA